MSTATAPTATPTKVGPYNIERELGRGAHGVVYRAAHRDRPQTPVALKVIENRGNLDRLMLEPEILSRLNHSSIVKLYDYFIDQERLVVAIEFIDGIELKEYLQKRGTLPPAEVREFLVQMAAALEHAHAQEVLHRDIKLTNILIEQKPEQKPRFVLSDFGISRISEGLQTTKHSGGTYHFMAPEQLRGRPEKASDLWALGVAAYVLLTGVQPFTGMNVEELSEQILYGIPKRPADINPAAADEELERIIYGLLEKQPTSRIASTQELLSQLKAAGRTPAEEKGQSQQVPNTYETRLKRKAWWNWIWFGLSAAFMAGPYGFVPQLFLLAGALRLYEELARKVVSFWASGVLLMLFGTILSFYFPLYFRDEVFSFLGLRDAVDRSAFILFSLTDLMGAICGLILPFFVVYYFGQARQIERDLALRQAIIQSSKSPNEYLQLLEGYAQHSSEDLQLRRRYIEALLANDRPKEAAVEARLLLEQDPYDFSGSLLLAQAYFDLGLHDLCQQTCDKYLQWAGYSFEFQELKSRCVTAVA